MVAYALNWHGEVRVPLMPKGVEHESNERQLERMLNVRVPLMPKGVEHCNGRKMQKAVLSESSFDAERR